MFTGLVEQTVAVRELQPFHNGVRFTLEAPEFLEELETGDSIAVNGCCLTVVECRGCIAFDLLGETLARTNFPAAKPGDRVNLERALRAGDRLGGHFVQGHVDCTAPVLHTKWRDSDFYVEFAVEPSVAHLLIPKGSIAVNGVSLTVATLEKTSFGVWLIPLTREKTNLGMLAEGSLVNLEFDMLAKQVDRILQLRSGGI